MAAANQEKKTPKETEIYPAEPEQKKPPETPPPSQEAEQPPVEVEKAEIEALPSPPLPRPAPPPPLVRPTGLSIVAQPVKRIASLLYRKTLRTVVIRLGKTAVGRTVNRVLKEGIKKLVKEGIKKVGAKVAAKLGIQAAITAVGAATTEVSAGVSAAIAFVVNVLIEIGSRIIGKAISFVKKLFEKPEALLAAGVGFGVVGLAFSAPAIIAIGATMIVIGAAPILAVAIPATVGGFFAAIGALPAVVFGALSAWTAGTLIAIATVVIVGVIATATWLQVMLTSSAFILPHKPEEITGETVTIGRYVDPVPGDQTGHLAAQVIYALYNCGIRQVTSSNRTGDQGWETCLRNAGLSGVNAIIDEFNLSVNQYGVLQCVGFVRAILQAQSIWLPRYGDAKKYLDHPEVSTDWSQLKVGDVMIMDGVGTGHIVILVEKRVDDEKGITYFRIAQADGKVGGWVFFTVLDVATDFIPYLKELKGYDGFISI